MSAALTISPPAPLADYSVVASGTGFAQYKTRLKLDGIVVATICRPTSGAFTSTAFSVGAAGTKSLTAEQNVAGVWGAAVATLSITVASAPTDPVGGTNFYDVPASLTAAIPGGSPTYTGSGSLATFLAGLTAGQWGVLDYNGDVTENINLSLADGVTIIPASGKTPALNGSLRIGGGVGVRIFGLNVHWSSPNPDAHMVKLDGGTIEYAYAEIHDAACYTLMRPGQTLTNSRLHHLWIHDNPGVLAHNGDQDHGLYCDPTDTAANILIDHCWIETMPRGRNIKIGGPGSGFTAFGGITIRKCSLKDGQGPSNAQVSNGATGIVFDHLLLSRSGSSTNLTSGTGAGTGSTYTNCKGDSTVGPNDSYLGDGGGNTNSVALATVEHYVTQGGLGYGHLAT